MLAALTPAAHACSNPAGPESVDDAIPETVRSMLSSCTKSSFATYTAHWDCGHTITIRDGTTSAGSDLSAAVDLWNAKISASGISGMPTFQVVTSPSADVSVVGASGGSVFCDATGATMITLYSGSVCDSYTNKDARLNVLTHALAHVYGWPSNAHKVGQPGASTHCAIHLPDDGSVNATVCAHEIEGAAAGYGLRSFDPSSFWDTPFATAFAGAFANQAITVGSTHQYTLFWLLDGVGATNGPVNFQSSNSSAASVSTMGLVSGNAIGTTTITATPGSGSVYLRTFAFENLSATALVTVNPLPLASLVVQDITINASLPLTSYGNKTWTAVMGPGDTTGITYRWVIEYSWSVPPDSIFIPSRTAGDSLLPAPWGTPPFAGPTWDGAVSNGSYNIRVKVWPARSGVVGMPAIRDFPVCPDGEQQWLSALRDEEVMAICPT